MSSAVISCPGCQAPLAITPELIGRTIACPACKTAITLAASSAGQARLPAAASTPAAVQGEPSFPVLAGAGAADRGPATLERSKAKPSGLPVFVVAVWGVVALMVIVAGVLVYLQTAGSTAAPAVAAKTKKPQPSVNRKAASQPLVKPAAPATESPAAIPAPAASANPAPPAVEPVVEPTPTPAPKPKAPKKKGSPQAPPPQNVTLQPSIGGVPIPLPVPASPQGGPLAGLDAAWKLPTLLSTQAERMASLDLEPPGPLTLSIQSGAADLPANAAIFSEADAGGTSWTVHYVAALDAQAQKIPLGTIRLAGREILFGWTDPPADVALRRQLSNCLVEVRQGNAVHLAQLRKPVAQSACKLDLEKNVQTVELQLAEPPKLDRVRLEIRELANFPSKARLRNDQQTVEVGQRAVIEFPDLAGAEMSVQLNKLATSGLVVRLESEFKENAVVKYDLSRSRLKALEEGMTKALDSANRELPAERVKLANLQGQLSSAAGTRATNLTEQAALQRAVSSLQGQVKRSANKVTALQKQIAECEARLGAVPTIRSFLDSLHERAELRYMLVAECGDRDVVLVDATQAAAGAE